MILLPPGSAFLSAPHLLSKMLLSGKDACLLQYSTEYDCGIGIMLSPVHFQRLEPR